MSYKLCLYDMDLWFEDKKNLEIIAEVDFEPEIGINLDINGNTYHICAKSPKGKLVGLKPISFSEEVEETYDEHFTCPFCGSIDHDAFELDEEGTVECGYCGSELEYERHYTVEYQVKPKQKNEAIRIGGLHVK